MKASTKKILIVSACLFAAGIIVFGVGLALGGRPGVEISSRGIYSDNQKADFYKSQKKQVDNFSSADINIDSTADVSVLPSGDDHYYIEYKLDGSYKKPYCSVDENTLTLKQKGSSVGIIGFFSLGTSPNGYIRLYVPKGKSMDSLTLYSDSGDLSFDGLSSASAHITANYGDVTMKNSNLGSLELNLGSGDLKLTDTQAKDFTLENDYGNAKIKYFACESSKIKLNSGDLYLDAAKSGNFDINNEYGDATLLLPDLTDTYQFDLSAAYGSIRLPHDASGSPSSRDDGDSQYYRTKGNGKYDIQVKSDDGDITIKKRP